MSYFFRGLRLCATCAAFEEFYCQKNNFPPQAPVSGAEGVFEEHFHVMRDPVLEKGKGFITDFEEFGLSW